MGAPKGNQNPRKGKDWETALRWALANYEDAPSAIKRGFALRSLAKTVVKKAMAGDKDAWIEIGNRLDGKPAQAITADVDAELTIRHESK